MGKVRQKKEQVRAPRQERSQRRVEVILETAKKLILDRGCAGLKVSDIAEAADITVGSIYQYFPNKSAIIETLCEDYLASNRLGIEASLTPPPKDLEELSHVCTDLLEEFYRLHRDDPVLRNIWANYASDKAIQGIDADDTRQGVEIILRQCSHLFDQTRLEEAALTLYLILSYGGASVTAAVHRSGPKGRQTIELAKRMLYAAYDAGIKPLGAKSG